MKIPQRLGDIVRHVDGRDVCFVAGLALMGRGAYLYSPPAAALLVGAVLVAASLSTLFRRD
jgi:hypothetical protein